MLTVRKSEQPKSANLKVEIELSIYYVMCYVVLSNSKVETLNFKLVNLNRKYTMSSRVIRTFKLIESRPNQVVHFEISVFEYWHVRIEFCTPPIFM